MTGSALARRVAWMSRAMTMVAAMAPGDHVPETGRVKSDLSAAAEIRALRVELEDALAERDEWRIRFLELQRQLEIARDDSGL